LFCTAPLSQNNLCALVVSTFFLSFFFFFLTFFTSKVRSLRSGTSKPVSQPFSYRPTSTDDDFHEILRITKHNNADLQECFFFNCDLQIKIPTNADTFEKGHLQLSRGLDCNPDSLSLLLPQLTWGKRKGGSRFGRAHTLPYHFKDTTSFLVFLSEGRDPSLNDKRKFRKKSK
jgi:hypothetical protein